MLPTESSSSRYNLQIRVITSLGFLRTFIGGLTGVGLSLFILKYWASNFFSGAAAGAISLTYIFSSVIFGRISDRIGRKRSLQIALGGNLIAALGYILMVVLVYFTKEVWLIWFGLSLRAIEGCFNGFFWPVLQSSISEHSFAVSTDISNYEMLTKAGMGKYNAGWNLGILSGTLSLSLLIYLKLLEISLILPIFINMTSLLIIFFLFKEPRSSRDKDVIVSGSKKKLSEKNDGVSDSIKKQEGHHFDMESGGKLIRRSQAR
ncbi:MAG: MFS transporter, partial [Promethearchaeota archaeon]